MNNRLYCNINRSVRPFSYFAWTSLWKFFFFPFKSLEERYSSLAREITLLIFWSGILGWTFQALHQRGVVVSSKIVSISSIPSRVLQQALISSTTRQDRSFWLIFLISHRSWFKQGSTRVCQSDDGKALLGPRNRMLCRRSEMSHSLTVSHVFDEMQK